MRRTITACVCAVQCLCFPVWSKTCWVGELEAAYGRLESDVCAGNQMRFFDAFPSTGEQYDLVFGYHPCLGDSSLYDHSYEMVKAFWSLRNVTGEVFYDKVAAVTSTLRYDADAPGQWQECVGKVLSEHSRQAEILIDRVALLDREHQMRFWSFMWSASADVDDRGLRDFHKRYIDEHYPQMANVYVIAREYFYDGVNLSSMTPRDYPE